MKFSFTFFCCLGRPRLIGFCFIILLGMSMEGLQAQCPTPVSPTLPFLCDVSPVQLKYQTPNGTGLYTQIWRGTDDISEVDNNDYQFAFSLGAESGTTCNTMPSHPNAPTTNLVVPSLGYIDATVGNSIEIGLPGADQGQQDGWLLIPKGLECISFRLGGNGGSHDGSALFLGANCSDMAFVGKNTNNGGTNTSDYNYSMPLNVPVSNTECGFNILRVRLYHHDAEQASNTKVQWDIGRGFEEVPTEYLFPATGPTDETIPVITQVEDQLVQFALVDENGGLWDLGTNGEPIPVEVGSLCYELLDFEDCAGLPAPSLGSTCQEILDGSPCDMAVSLVEPCWCLNPENVFTGTQNVSLYKETVIVTSELQTGMTITGTGFLDASGAPLGMPLALTLESTNTWVVDFYHDPLQGYSGQVCGVSGICSPIGNTCYLTNCNCGPALVECPDGLTCNLECDATPISIERKAPVAAGTTYTQVWTATSTPPSCCRDLGNDNPSPLNTGTTLSPFDALDVNGLPTHINGPGTVDATITTLGMADYPNPLATEKFTTRFGDQAQQDAWIIIPPSIECVRFQFSTTRLDAAAFYIGEDIDNMDFIGDVYYLNGWDGSGSTAPHIYDVDLAGNLINGDPANSPNTYGCGWREVRARIYSYDAKIYFDTRIQWDIGNGFEVIPREFLHPVLDPNSANSNRPSDQAVVEKTLPNRCAFMDSNNVLYDIDGSLTALNPLNCEAIGPSCESCPQVYEDGNGVVCDLCTPDILNAELVCNLPTNYVTITPQIPEDGSFYTQYWTGNEVVGDKDGTNLDWTAAFSILNPTSCLPEHPNPPTGNLLVPSIGVSDTSIPNGAGVGSSYAENVQQDGWLLIPEAVSCLTLRIGGTTTAWDASSLYLGVDLGSMEFVGDNLNARGQNPAEDYRYYVPTGAAVLACNNVLRARLYHHDSGTRADTRLQWDLGDGNGFVVVPASALIPTTSETDQVLPTSVNLVSGAAYSAYENDNNYFDLDSMQINVASCDLVTVDSLADVCLSAQVVDFYGKTHNCEVKLVWETASERQTAYFEILKSTEGDTWESIGIVPASVNSDETLRYELDDLQYGEALYTLVLHDQGDRVSYRKTIAVKTDCTGNFFFTPNPSHGWVKIQIADAHRADIYSLLVVDALGRLVSEDKIPLEMNDEYRLDLSHLPNGIYFARMVSSDGSHEVTQKIILAR